MRQLIKKKTAVMPLATIALAFALVSTILLYAHAESEPGPTPERDRLLPVATFSPEQVDQFPVTTRYTGLVQSRRAATLAFEPEGRVARIAVEAGEAVTQGQALAALDTRRLEASLREVEGEIEATEAALTLAREEEERQRNLRSDGASTRRDVDRAVAERRQRQGQLNSLAGRRDRIQANLDDAVLTAPFDGVIAERRVEQGDLVAAGTSAFRILQPDNLEARIGMPAAQARHYEVGDAVRLTIDETRVQGQILDALPEIDRARRTMTLRVALVDDGGTLVPGQMAHLHHQGSVSEEGFVVPETALTGARSGLWALLVAEPVADDRYRVRRVNVEWLNSENGRALVRGPLDPGMKVIADGAHRVVPGQAVTIVDQAEDETP